MSAFSTALSGLLSNSTALNVVGDNLANLNTNGFKSNSVQFLDLVNEANSNLQLGAGVGSTITNRSFAQGSLQTTGGSLDAAVSGNGFFIVKDTAGNTLYTRDGSFTVDQNGFLASNGSGALIQGWTAVNGVLNASGAVGNISLSALQSLQPVPTANFTLSANLDAGTATNGTFSTPIQIEDSLGQAHTVTATFTKTGDNAWSYTVTMPGEDVSGGKAGTPSQLGTGNITFDATGKLTSPAAPGVVALKSTGTLADGAAALAINWNLFDSSSNPTLTQFAQTSASSGTTQDGQQAAELTGVSIQTGGNLVASYSNGKQITVAQIALAAIQNPDSLQAASNNNYTLGAGTITPSVGAAGTANRGGIVGGSLEASNVDMATQFTNLIVFQRGYQANSKVLTAEDQIEQTLLQINP
jgi:flagellar hook protein FlgE